MRESTSAIVDTYASSSTACSCIDRIRSLTRSRQAMGTIDYGAPEQFESAKHVDQRCDLYSFGATLYTALTGKFPFGNGGRLPILQRKFYNEFVPPRLLLPELDPALDDLVSRCLQADPMRRPSACSAVLAVLRNHGTAGPAPTAAPVPVKPRSVRDRRANVRFASSCSE